MASVSVYRSCSLPHSRFLDVTQRFPQNTAADELANHSSGSIFRNLFAPDSPFETRPIRYRLLSRSSCGKVSQATQDKWRRLKKLFAKRRQSSKFPSLMLTRSLQLGKFSSRRKMFLWKVLTGQTRLISSWSRCDTWPYSSTCIFLSVVVDLQLSAICSLKCF